MTVPEATPRDHAAELRNMHTCLLAGGADWSDVLLDAAEEFDRLRARVAELELELEKETDGWQGAYLEEGYR